MSLVPVDWSVVIVGRWNRAILTPAGIGKRLFELPEGTPVEVMLAIDAIAPPRVSHDGIIVVAGNDRLMIQPESCEYVDLDRARQLAKKALCELPETPISGVGINIRFKSEESELALDKIIDSTWDDELSDNDYSIQERGVKRSLAWQNGTINISITSNENGKQFVQFNFDMQALDVATQNQWLDVPIGHIQSEVKKILFATMGLEEEVFTND